MDSFSSPSSGASSSDVVEQIRQQIAQAHAEEFMETLRVKCFDKCITKTGSRLSGNEGSCITWCVERYIEAIRIMAKALFEKH